MKYKEIIAKWIKKENLAPDYDGYLGEQRLPKEIMEEYIRLFPDSWD